MTSQENSIKHLKEFIPTPLKQFQKVAGKEHSQTTRNTPILQGHCHPNTKTVKEITKKENYRQI